MRGLKNRADLNLVVLISDRGAIDRSKLKVIRTAVDLGGAARGRVGEALPFIFALGEVSGQFNQQVRRVRFPSDVIELVPLA